MRKARTLPAEERSSARPYVIINMVSSLDGKVTVGGQAGSIGSPIDRVLMRALRAHADAVMMGAGTLRAEKLTLAVPEDLARARARRGLKSQPLAVVATVTGDIPLQENLLGPSPYDLLLLVSPETPEERLTTLPPNSSFEVVPEETAPSLGGDSVPRLDLAKALETLKTRYATGVLLVEGGPSLNHALVREGLADELFLTLAPKLLGGTQLETLTVLEGPAIPPQKTKLISVHLSGDELFLRYALERSDE